MARKKKPSGLKKRKRSISSYQRKFGGRKVGESILIVCEGEKTEPDYFTSLRRRFNLATVQVEIRGEECDPAPISVVNYALVKKEERDKLIKNSQTSLPQYQHIWCVCDVENPNNNTTLNEAINKANSVDFLTLALSNPAFEFWFLLHFQNTSRPYSNATEVIADLKTHLPKYEKSKCPFDLLFDNTEDAIQRSKRIISNHIDQGDICPNPSTLVHELIEKLISMAR